MDNFIITCRSGRTGTKFLSKIMNRSEKWTVIHDNKVHMFYPPYADEDENVTEINERLNQNNYGEICGGFYFNIEKYDVSKKGYIIRNPIQELISIINFNPNRSIDYFFSSKINWKEEIENIDRNIIESGEYIIIKFDDMISDVDYFHSILAKFNIDDVKVTNADLKTKVNSSIKKRISGLNDFTPEQRNRLEYSYNWYIEKYNLRK